MLSNGQPFKLLRSYRVHWALNSDSKGLMKIQGLYPDFTCSYLCHRAYEDGTLKHIFTAK